MINYILKIEELLYKERIKLIIEKVMINNNIDYNIKEYNNKISSNYNIYIFQNNNYENIIKDIKIIRENDDWQSMIIIITNNTNKIQNNNYFIMDKIEIEKYTDQRLTRDIQILIKNYDQRPNRLKFTYKKILYNIAYKDILYIEKEINSKNCIIKTKDNEYLIQDSIQHIYKNLDKRFIKCSKSNIINIEQVRYYDIKNNLIVFDDKNIISNISRDKKREIKESLRGII